MLQRIHRALGWRLKLGESKSADGLQAARWFRQGQLDKVTGYCRRDVEVTWKACEFGQQNGYIKWRVH